MAVLFVLWSSSFSAAVVLRDVAVLSQGSNKNIPILTCMHVTPCMLVYKYVCTCMCVCTYVCMHIHKLEASMAIIVFVHSAQYNGTHQIFSQVFFWITKSVCELILSVDFYFIPYVNHKTSYGPDMSAKQTAYGCYYLIFSLKVRTWGITLEKECIIMFSLWKTIPCMLYSNM